MEILLEIAITQAVKHWLLITESVSSHCGICDYCKVCLLPVTNALR
jgi:hypothetical protein